MKRYLIIAVIIAIAILLAGLLYDQFRLRTNVPVDGIQPEDIVRPGFPNAGHITVRHDFAGGMHTYSGILTLPDPCHEINAQAIMMESFPEQVRIEITTRRDQDVLCAQVLTDKPFSVSFQASEQAQVQALLNGKRVELIEHPVDSK